MSIRVLSKVMKHSEATLGCRLVLFALADAAHDDGITWIAQEQLREKTRMSERQIRDDLRWLEAEKEIETRKAQRGRRRINVYRVTLADLEPDYSRLPFVLDEPFSRPAESAAGQDGDDRRFSSSTTGGFRPSTRARPSEPSISTVKDSTPLEPPVAEAAIRAPANRPSKVDRVKVSDGEYALAAAALEAFNRVAGTRYAGKDWIGKIVMRVREHPGLTLAGHAAAIVAAFSDPWWKGPPSPSVVYGNGALFERCLHAVHAASAGRSLTPTEVADYGTKWGPGTQFETPLEARIGSLKRPGYDVEVEASEVA